MYFSWKESKISTQRSLPPSHFLSELQSGKTMVGAQSMNFDLNVLPNRLAGQENMMSKECKTGQM